MKFISFVDFEHEKKPTADGENASRALAKPVAALVNASCHEATRNLPFSRTIGSVIRKYGSNFCFVIFCDIFCVIYVAPELFTTNRLSNFSEFRELSRVCRMNGRAKLTKEE